MKAEQDFPDDVALIYRQAILSLSERDVVASNQYIEKFISLSKDNSTSEESITMSLAAMYSEAGILDKAEEYYRKAISSEPDNLNRMNILARFLIDKDRNINEGMELIDKALALSLENWDMLDTKGWGLYKQGKYREAVEILQKSWDLRMKDAVYNHEAFLHLEAAKKAVESQKRTGR